MFIVLGVTGGIAAYKSIVLARLLVEGGHEVHVVPTEDALRFVGKPTWEAISRRPVTTSVHEDVPEVRHVALGQRADLVIVAPATANTLAKMTAGLADDLLGTTLLATRAPVLVAPAMHTEMWQHPATQQNLATLRDRGVVVVGPESGRLTGDDSGPGRMSEPEQIAAAALRLAAGGAESAGAGTPGTRDDWHGLAVLVTAGGTREPIDPVRYLGNRSSGRQGVAVAVAAAERGARVRLLAANVEDAVLAEAGAHPTIRIERVGTAAELEAAASAAAAGVDVVVMAAAVADYRVDSVAEGKLRKEDTAGAPPVLRLVENPDILAGIVAARPAGQTLVGFAAETAESEEELLERGRRKRRRKGVDLLAVNAVGWAEGFETGRNTLHLIDAADELIATVGGSKREAAEGLLDAVLALRGRDETPLG
ncbi:bifunctional phosphopantothenoylcysteine decarboxylase/phosphopantothenate--cysteine ligase CoaBC [Leucobacter sp. CSA1]|uniref:Coenzyme A biosynthesis bifunctional protein CoaBC n=1 Tax=Leucobacter chromiisoli TaxID=2796471 RepID=A0A934UW58_9MICO|nr:bifunctional phosphopantothenoylcysteine decarboxylase/phosphopantothenate--cysteine ligase CoaBC [Leucobacter chromiisoli]MBK0419928.1 bifunctional phosphopantothenoylcysteine decarboxylase/phosphopantothenate--cysteine ligase CoaBC [Leucobacter chromiisoli]